MSKSRWEEILEEFGHPVLDSHTTLERELAEHIAELEAILHKMETESDILSEDFLDMKDYLNTVIKDNETFRKELKELSLEPLTYDGENNDEVDSFTAGYNAALEDMRDILQKYFPT